MRSFRTIKIDGITDSVLKKSKLLDRRSVSINSNPHLREVQGAYYLGMRLTDKNSMPDIYSKVGGTEATQADESTVNTKAQGNSTLSTKYLPTEHLHSLGNSRTPSMDFGPFSHIKSSMIKQNPVQVFHKKTRSQLTNDLLDTTTGYKMIQKKTGNTVPISKARLFREPEEVSVRPRMPRNRKLVPIVSLSTPKMSSLREELNDIVRDPKVLLRYQQKHTEAEFIEKNIHFKKMINEKENTISQKIRQLNDRFKDARQKLNQLKNRIIEGPLTRIEL